jgi:hypothetical protein
MNMSERWFLVAVATSPLVFVGGVALLQLMPG